MNLNGRIVGKMNGKILVALTVEEYLDSLPQITIDADGSVSAAPAAATPRAPAVVAQTDPDPAPAHGRPRGKSTPAQRRFAGARAVNAGKAPKAALDEKACVICGKPYKPRRCDQKTCLAPACRQELKLAMLKDYRAKHAKPKKTASQAAPAAAPAKAGHLTHEQKQARLDAIKAAAARVKARNPAPARIPGASLAGETGGEPVELRQAAEAAAEG